MGVKNFSINELKTFAELARNSYQNWISYRDDTDKKKRNSIFTVDEQTFIVKDVLNDPNSGVYAFLAEDNKGNKYIVFRGTEDGQDLSSDIDILMGKAPKQLKVAQKWINDLRNNGLISKSDFSKRGVAYQTKILLN